MSDTDRDRRETVARERDMTTSDFDRLLDKAVSVLEQRVSRPNPLALDSWEQIVQFAEMAARTNMVPKDYLGKPDNIILAILQGKELGLPAIQSIQSIAMVNGRPSVWGDAVPGLCYSRGVVEDHQEYFEGTEGQDDFTAVCIVKRKGIAAPKKSQFSQADAKKAGLYGQNVHGKYPRRMMQWRARHGAFHDAFPDILRGIGTREIEAEDAVPTPGWAMPPPEKGWFTSKPQARSDGWDDTWFAGAMQKLAGEPNAWKWMDVLIGCLADAPSLRDIQEINDLPQVETVLAGAPDTAKKTIEDAFAAARERFSERKPAAPAQGQSQGDAPVDRDSAGVAWDERLHASTKAKNVDGTWRARRGVEKAAPPASAPPQGAGLFGGDAQGGQPSQAIPPQSGGFSRYLLDEAGKPMPDGDGVLEPFTDPEAWAAAYVDARDSFFPGDLPGFEAANAEAAREAMAASKEVVAIIGGGAPETHQDEPEGAAIPWPEKPSAADAKIYMAALKAALDGCSDPDAINLVIDHNAPTYDQFPPKYRLEAKALVQTRQQAISPAPARGQETPTIAEFADAIIADIASLETLDDLNTWKQFTTAIAEVEKVRREAPDHHARIQAAITKRETDLKVAVVRSEWDRWAPGNVLEELIKRIKEAKTLDDLFTVQASASFISGGAVVKQSEALFAELGMEYQARKKALGG